MAITIIDRIDTRDAMSADTINLIILLLSGAAGGHISGALLKQISLGLVGNTVVGILGGAIGGPILATSLNSPAAAAGNTGAIEISAMVGLVAAGGVGGGLSLVMLEFLKQVVQGKRI